MAEFPRPRLLVQLVRHALNEVVVRLHRRVTEEYRRPGPRDN